MASVRETILLNLETALDAIRNSLDYETQIKEVSRYDENVLLTTNFQTPLIMIIDVAMTKSGCRTQPITDSG